MARIRTNIEIEEVYVRRIMDRYGIHTKTEAVDLALRHLAGRAMTREEALATQGAHAVGEIPPDGPPAETARYSPTQSAWVEYDRAMRSPVHQHVAALIATDGPLSVTEPVIMEVLAGARSDQRELDLRRLLARFTLLRFDAAADFAGAVRVYRRCRSVGVNATWHSRLHDRGGGRGVAGLRCSHRIRICNALGRLSALNWTKRRNRPELAYFTRIVRLSVTPSCIRLCAMYPPRVLA
jgi:hypothetical protein